MIACQFPTIHQYTNLLYVIYTTLNASEESSMKPLLEYIGKAVHELQEKNHYSQLWQISSMQYKTSIILMAHEKEKSTSSYIQSLDEKARFIRGEVQFPCL